MASQKSAEKWKTKVWFDVYAPTVFGDIVIGSVPASDEKAIIGRVIKVSLSWVTHNPSHSFLTAWFRISEAKGNVAHTTLDNIEQIYSYTHSLVRRHGSVIYTRDITKDKAGKGMVLKLIIITRSKIKTPKKTSIRREVSKFVKDYTQTVDSDDLVRSMIDGKFQAEGIKKIQNIASVSKFEVRKAEF